MSEGGSSAYELNDDDMGFGFQVGGQNDLICQSCFGTRVKVKEDSIVCKDCGFEFRNKEIGATLEYNDFGKVKAAKVKKDEVMEKLKAESPTRY